MKTMRSSSRSLRLWLALAVLAGVSGCSRELRTTDLLEANLARALSLPRASPSETVALSGRLLDPDAGPLQNARVTFVARQGAGAFATTTDSAGFWRVDLTVPTVSLQLEATVERDQVAIATFAVTIAIVRRANGSTVNVSTTVTSGNIVAEASAYVRSSLLVSNAPALLREGEEATLQIKFNQVQESARQVTIESGDPAVLLVEGGEQHELNFSSVSATVDQAITLTAPLDADLSSQTATLTIRSEGIPDVILSVVLEDSDVARMDVVGSSTLGEAGLPAIVWVRPAFAPEAPMAFQITSADPERLSVGTPELTFTPEDYQTPQAVAGTGIPDADWYHDTVRLRFSSTSLPAPILVDLTLTDDDPGLAPAVSVPSGATSALAVCDFDGDGRADAVVADAASARVLIYRSTSGGGALSLTAPVAHPVLASGALGLQCRDVDGDGRPDLTMVHRSLARAELVRNTSSVGSISAAAGLVLTTGAGPTDSLVVDLDGDGRPDVVTADREAGQLSLLRNTGSVGSPAFSATVLAIGPRPAFLALADPNGDSRPDLLVVHDFASLGSVAVLENQSSPGSATFAPARTLDGLAGFAAAAVDTDGDGRAELWTVSDSGSVLRRVQISPSFDFVQESFPSGMNGLPSAIFARPAASLDLDLDGRPDLFLADPLTGAVRSFRSLVNGGLTPGQDIAQGAPFQNLASGDLDGDGRPDLVATDTTGQLHALRNQAPTP